MLQNLEKKTYKKSSPKQQPKTQSKADYRISVVNKKVDKSSFDFNFSRDFKFKKNEKKLKVMISF